jgi:hypothetical protein
MRTLNAVEIQNVSGGLLGGVFSYIIEKLADKIIDSLDDPRYNSAAGPGPLGPQNNPTPSEV